MPTCETRENEYDKAFQILKDGKTHTFDSFECAITALAPRCAACDVGVMGHGLEKGGMLFCCNHCAAAKGVTGLRDRA